MSLDDRLWQIGKLGRLRFSYQIRQRQGVFELFVGFNTAVAIGILGLVARWTSWPLIFPSLGPSLFLIFYAPQRPMSAPRNTFLAHLLGGVLGYFIYILFNFLGIIDPRAFTFGSVLSSALALGISGFLMVRLNILHPPAASTALIASLGYLPQWYHLLVLALALVILILQAKLFHFVAGVKYPWWSPKEDETPAIMTSWGKVTVKPKSPQNLGELADILVMKGPSAFSAQDPRREV